MRASFAIACALLLAACGGPRPATHQAPPCDSCTGPADAGSEPESDAGTADAGVADAGVPDAGAADGGVVSLPRRSPLLDENALGGGTGWRPGRWVSSLAAYVDRTSYLPGDSVEVHAAAAAPASATWTLWRLGYYGGAGGRLVLSGNRPVQLPAWTAGVLDPSTGAVRANWPAAFSLSLPADAVTGVYVLEVASAGAVALAMLVVREPAPRAPILYSVSSNTYQAYNAWGGTSLYRNRRSDWKAAHAFAVSFDRPYDQGAGTGDLLDKDRDFITFAEGQGYDIAYVTDADLDAEPALVQGRRMLVVQGHSEYWTAAMRDAFDAAVAAGTNVAFFGANTAYWQARFASADRRLLISYKEFASLDPVAPSDPGHVTTRFRDAPVNRPENALVGEMFGDWIWTAAPLSVEDPGSWLWTGAGVSRGTMIAGVYDDEVDRRYRNGSEPAGVELVGSAFVEAKGLRYASAETTLYTAPSGALVFSAGSIFWSRALAGPGTWDARIQQAVANIFSRFAGDGSLGPSLLAPLRLPPPAAPPAYRPGVQVTTLPAALASPAAIAVAPNGDYVLADGNQVVRVTPAGAVSTIAGAEPGDADGPLAQARFRGPRGVAVARNGDIYVADTGNERIRLISRGAVRTLAGWDAGFADGPGAQARFSQPIGIALLPSGQLLVADSRNNRLRAIDGRGRVTTWAGTGADGVAGGPGSGASLFLPTSVAVLPSGDAVIIEAATGFLRKVSAAPRHEVSVLAGEIGRTGWSDGPLATASLSETWSLAPTAGGDLILADGATARIRAIRAGQIETLAGGQEVGTRDGPGESAAFACPRAIAVAPDGSVLVADPRDHVLRRLTLPQ